MKLAIVGSRNFHDYKSFEAAVDKTLDIWKSNGIINNESVEVIVSGGAVGADTLAELYAFNHNIPPMIFKPDYKTYGGFAPLQRNSVIVDNSTHMIAFPSRQGKGTQDSIKKAMAKGIPIKVLYID